jgi:hypothetical protein
MGESTNYDQWPRVKYIKIFRFDCIQSWLKTLMRLLCL